MADAQSSAEGRKAQGDPSIGKTQKRSGAAHPAVGLDLQVEKANSRRSDGFGEWGGRRNARKSPENNPVSAPLETGDQTEIVVGELVCVDLKVGARIGEHDIESDSSRPGIQEPVDQTGPYGLKQRPGKRRQIGLGKRRVVNGDEHRRCGRDIAAPGFGDLQREIVEQAVQAAEGGK